MELCNKGYNSNLKNLLVKHQNNSVYCHRWRLLSGVSLICFYGIILEIFLAELYGWLTPDERAFARLYPWNHEVAIFLGRRRESEVIYRKNCTCRGCFARSGLNTHPTPRGNWVFILYASLFPAITQKAWTSDGTHPFRHRHVVVASQVPVALASVLTT